MDVGLGVQVMMSRINYPTPECQMCATIPSEIVFMWTPDISLWRYFLRIVYRR